MDKINKNEKGYKCKCKCHCHESLAMHLVPCCHYCEKCNTRFKNDGSYDEHGCIPLKQRPSWKKAHARPPYNRDYIKLKP